MRPKLKMSNIVSLQDARSCAAVGFDVLSFSLARGSRRKMTPSLIWNIVNWIEGPEIALELNAESLEELKPAKESFTPNYVCLPFGADKEIEAIDEGLIVHVRDDVAIDAMEDLLSTWSPKGTPFLFELHIEDWQQLEKYESIWENSFVHFPSLTMAASFLQSESPLPYGFSFHEEAEEEFGVLHYEGIDEFIDIFSDRFPDP